MASPTPRRPFIANETAADETPARRATSSIVGRRRLVYRRAVIAHRIAGTLAKRELKRFSHPGGGTRDAQTRRVGRVVLAATSAPPRRRRAGAVDDRPPAGPARGRGRRAGPGRRLPGRPLLRERLAHHRRDGRHLDAAAEARSTASGSASTASGSGPATRFTSGWGYTRYRAAVDRRAAGSQRTDVAPDGAPRRAVRPELTNPGGRAHRDVKVDAHSELMGAATRGASTARTPNASDNAARHAAPTTAARCVFRDQGAARRRAARLRRGRRLRPRRRPAARPAPATTRPAARHGVRRPSRRGPMPQRLRRRPVRQGHRRQLRYRVTVPAGGSKTLWIAVAGSDRGPRAARAEFATALTRPGRRAGGEDRAARAARELVAALRCRATRGSRDGDRLGQAEPGRPHADRRGPADPLDQPGQAVPAAAGPVPRARWSARASPTTRGCSPPTASTRPSPASRSASSRPTRTTCARCATSPRCSTTGTGMVVHEVVSDGSIWFGKDTRRPTRRHDRDDFNTDETVKFPSAVALIWRWTGDDALPRRHVRLLARNLHYVDAQLDEDGDGWPEGSATSSAPGMGEEKLDNAVYLIRGLYDLADMAKANGDAATRRGRRAGRRPRRGVREHVVDRRRPPVRRLARRSPAHQSTEALDRREPDGGRALRRRRSCRARDLRARHDGPRGARDRLLQRRAPVQPRPVPHGLRGRPRRARASADLLAQHRRSRRSARATTAASARAAARYTDADAETMFGEPATGGEPDEQPGAMPEILPSPGLRRAGPPDKNIDRCWTCRSMFMQAWGNYGTAWPVVHQQLGVRPDLGRAASRGPAAAVGPPSRAATSGSAAARSTSPASHDGNRYRPRSTRAARRRAAHRPHAAARREAARVTLDGRRAGWSGGGPTAARRSRSTKPGRHGPW